MDVEQDAIGDVLLTMNEEYTFKVNHAIEADRWDLVQDLTNAYFDDAQKVISASTSASGDQRAG